ARVPLSCATSRPSRRPDGHRVSSGRRPLVRNGMPLVRGFAAVAILLAARVAGAQDAAPAPAPAAAPSVDLEKVRTTLATGVQRRMDADHIPSVSLALVRGGDVVWAEAFGVSNVWAKTPATADTIYSTGSTFKSVVSVAILQLVEQGKLSLDSKLSDLLP